VVWLFTPLAAALKPVVRPVPSTLLTHCMVSVTGMTSWVVTETQEPGSLKA
jgi:hypothetical protein